MKVVVAVIFLVLRTWRIRAMGYCIVLSKKHKSRFAAHPLSPSFALPVSMQMGRVLILIHLTNGEGRCDACHRLYEVADAKILRVRYQSKSRNNVQPKHVIGHRHPQQAALVPTSRLSDCYVGFYLIS